MTGEMLLIELWEDRLRGITELVREMGINHIISRPYLGNVIAVEEFRPSGIIISGGTPNISEIEKYPFLRTTISLTQKAVEEGIPVLGICLGHQVLATAIGGTVRKALNPEVGFYEVRHHAEGIMENAQNPLTVFQYHFDEVAGLPASAKILAFNSNSEIQAFSTADGKSFGVQFHPEISLEKGISIISGRRKILEGAGFNVPKMLEIGRISYKETQSLGVLKSYLRTVSVDLQRDKKKGG
jgi:GMP synthase-like glutamine amidotransferase